MSALGDPGSMYLDKYFDFVLRKCRTGVHVACEDLHEEIKLTHFIEKNCYALKGLHTAKQPGKNCKFESSWFEAVKLADRRQLQNHRQVK